MARTCGSAAACSVSCTGAHGPASVANRVDHSARVRVAIALPRISTASAVLAAICSAEENRSSSMYSVMSMCRQTSAQNFVGCIITKEM